MKEPSLDDLKLISCSTQLNMEFSMLISVKKANIAGILKFISMVNTTSEKLKAIQVYFFLFFSISNFKDCWNSMHRWVEHKKNGSRTIWGFLLIWRFRLKDLSIDEMVGAWCFCCCQAQRGLPVRFLLFYLLVSPYLCLISFLYLDLYVQGDDALISWVSFMQTKHLYLDPHLEVCAPLNRFKPSNKIVLLAVPRRCFFCGSFILFLSCFVLLSCTSVCWCLVVTCLERADLLALSCDVWFWRCHFPIGILGQVWCLIDLIPDLCPLSYFQCIQYAAIFWGRWSSWIALL